MATVAALEEEIDDLTVRVATLEEGTRHRDQVLVRLEAVLTRVEDRLRRLELRVAVIAAVAGGGGAGLGEVALGWFGG